MFFCFVLFHNQKPARTRHNHQPAPPTHPATNQRPQPQPVRPMTSTYTAENPTQRPQTTPATSNRATQENRSPPPEPAAPGDGSSWRSCRPPQGKGNTGAHHTTPPSARSRSPRSGLAVAIDSGMHTTANSPIACARRDGSRPAGARRRGGLGLKVHHELFHVC